MARFVFPFFRRAKRQSGVKNQVARPAEIKKVKSP
jgi:hypothetical protein